MLPLVSSHRHAAARLARPDPRRYCGSLPSVCAVHVVRAAGLPGTAASPGPRNARAAAPVVLTWTGDRSPIRGCTTSVGVQVPPRTLFRIIASNSRFSPWCRGEDLTSQVPSKATTPSAWHGKPPPPTSRSPWTSPPGCRTSSRPFTRSWTRRPPRWTGPGSSCRRIWPAPNSSPDDPEEEHNASSGHSPIRRHPALDQFADPQPAQGLSAGTLVAVALNPLDIAIVNDQFPLRRLQPPTSRATRRSCSSATAPAATWPARPPRTARWPSWCRSPIRAGFPVPVGLDPASPPPSGWPGWSDGWRWTTAVTSKPVRRSWSWGQAARRASWRCNPPRILGAGRVVGAARGQALGQAADRGTDAVVDLADDQAIDAGLAAAAPGGYDVIVDFLWTGWPPMR